MRADEIRELSDADLRARLGELEEEQFRLKFRSATEALENPMRLRSVRKDIARVKTILRERELGSASGAKTSVKQPKRAAAKRAGAR